MAKFIVIDGLDGCGKATQTELLAKELESQGKKVVKLEFPKYDSDSSMAVRMYLNGDLGKDASNLNPFMCSSFYAVDRFIQYYQENKKYFEEDDNTVIISDRYISANIIHQGGKIKSNSEREEFVEWCYEYEHGKCGLPVEDATIILSIPIEISQKLMTERYSGDETKKDIHEQNIAYLKQCYAGLEQTLDAMKSRIHIPSQWCELSCLSVRKDYSAKDNANSEKTTEELMEDMYELASIEKIHHNVMKIVEKVLKGENVHNKHYACFFLDSQYDM